jgi:hypothetical protein
MRCAARVRVRMRNCACECMYICVLFRCGIAVMALRIDTAFTSWFEVASGGLCPAVGECTRSVLGAGTKTLCNFIGVNGSGVEGECECECECEYEWDWSEGLCGCECECVLADEDGGCELETHKSGSGRRG